MLIEVTDQNDVYVPRFCYHNKLSVAANCRMCLVEVEKAPKPLPACATPVADGMVVKTQSALALQAQKSVMEFLLINHPLDCPICDQGGECELQDLALGYGSDVSRYQENKRVVKDKNIGPLIQTDLTRCIHCTRCVRFGEEIAGLRELGATGRGEHMQIGTYIEKSLQSELSGNIIDLCPVGALTSKPFRYSARAWEMQQRNGIAPHDCVGSNVEFHVRGNKVMRIVPAANEQVNEVWLSDRDRFSYEGLYSDDRLLQPMLKQQGEWVNVSWDEALAQMVSRLDAIKQDRGAEQIGCLVSPSLTNEEYFLLDACMRGIGSKNIDHRLQQVDFSMPELDGPFPWLGQSIADIEKNDLCLLIGANTRYDVPMINHRIRKAWKNGAGIIAIHEDATDFNFDLSEQIQCNAGKLFTAVQTVSDRLSQPGQVIDDTFSRIASRLTASNNASILLGNAVNTHAQRAQIIAVCRSIADKTGARFGLITNGSNTAGAWLAGAIPHRQAFQPGSKAGGLNAQAMLQASLDACLLYHIEPDVDVTDHELMAAALQSAGLVVAFTAFTSASLLEHADILLPIALYAENEGSLTNIEGRVQGFKQAVKPAGEIQPGWRILRKLANLLGVDGIEYQSIAEVHEQFMSRMETIQPAHGPAPSDTRLQSDLTGQTNTRALSMYAIDPLVRRSRSLAAVSGVAAGT